YGDALNPYLFKELSGMGVQNKDYLPTLYKRLQRVLLFFTSFNKELIKASIFPWQKSVLGIGSIIRMANQRTAIWGSGFMNKNEKCKGGRLYAVRGRLTSEKLNKEGFPLCQVYGDPALLLPLWVPAQKKRNKIAIIPHFKEVEYFHKKYGDCFHIIDLRTKDVE